MARIGIDEIYLWYICAGIATLLVSGYLIRQKKLLKKILYPLVWVSELTREPALLVIWVLVSVGIIHALALTLISHPSWRIDLSAVKWPW